jgi:hypothetical protein
MKKNLVRNISNLCLGFVLMVVLVGCETQEIQVSEIEFFIAKEWRIESVFKDGILQTEADMKAADKLENYRLTLNDDFTFTRVFFNGEVKEGTWQLTSGLTQVVLFVDDPDEQHWLLLDLAIRRLEMRLLQAPNKPQLDIRYVLIPVKGR